MTFADGDPLGGVIGHDRDRVGRLHGERLYFGGELPERHRAVGELCGGDRLRRDLRAPERPYVRVDRAVGFDDAAGIQANAREQNDGAVGRRRAAAVLYLRPLRRPLELIDAALGGVIGGIEGFLIGDRQKDVDVVPAGDELIDPRIFQRDLAAVPIDRRARGDAHLIRRGPRDFESIGHSRRVQQPVVPPAHLQVIALLVVEVLLDQELIGEVVESLDISHDWKSSECGLPFRGRCRSTCPPRWSRSCRSASSGTGA